METLEMFSSSKVLYGVCVGDWILELVLSEHRQTEQFAIFVDEAIGVSVSEQISLVLQFVDSSQIHEAYVGFVLCDTGTSDRALTRFFPY